MNDLTMLCSMLPLGYIGVVMYFANVAEQGRAFLNATTTADKLYGSRQHDQAQRTTIVRILLAFAIAGLFVFPFLLLQMALVPEMVAEAQMAKVDLFSAAVLSVYGLIAGVTSIRTLMHAPFRERLKTWTGGAFNPDSQVHITAVILSLGTVMMIWGSFVANGGLEGLAANGNSSSFIGGVAEEAIFQAVVFVAAAFLGIGFAIRRGVPESLARLGLRMPTRDDWAWGVLAGIGLFGVYMLMAAAWAALSTAEQLKAQTALSSQLLESYSTLPIALIVSLAAAVSEEILFRGALQPIFGLWPTSLLFAAIHIQYTLTPASLIVLVVALGLGWVRQKYSTSASIIGHFMYNFVQLALVILAPQLGV